MSINPTSSSPAFKSTISSTTTKPSAIKQPSWKERIQTTFSKIQEELSERFHKLKVRITRIETKNAHAALTKKASETLRSNDVKATTVETVEPVDVFLPADPDLLFKKLPNGISYYVKKSAHPFPEKVYISMIVKAGYLNETHKEFGIAQVVHNCAFRETENFGLNEIKSYFASKGLEWGKDLTSKLSSDHTIYHINLPIQDAEALEKIFAILSDIAFRATLTDSIIDNQRELVHDELLQSRSVKNSYQQRFYPTLTIGTEHEKIYDVEAEALNVKECPSHAIRAFYKKWYKPENMAIIAVGDFKDDKAIGNLIEKHFGKITGPTSQPVDKPIKFVLPAKPQFTCFSDAEVTSTQAEIYYPLPPDNNRLRTLRDCRTTLIHNFIDQACVNRLREVIGQTGTPFIMASARKTNIAPGYPCFRAAMTVKEGELQRGFKELLIELKRLKTHGITADEFARIKEDLEIALDHRVQESNKTTPSTLKNHYKTHFLRRSSLATAEELAKTMLSQIKEIKLEDVNERIAYLLQHNNCIVGTVEPQKEGLTPTTEANLTQVIEEVKKSTVAPYVSTNITKPLLDHVPNAGKIVETTLHPKSGVTEYTLENGIKVYFKPTTFKNDYVGIEAHSAKGLHSVHFKDRASALLGEDFFDECGFGNFSNTEIHKVLSGKNVSFQSQIGNFTTTINTSSVRRDLETSFQLIYLMFTNPGYTKEAFESALSQAKERLKNVKNSPRAQFADLNLHVHTQGHSTFKPLQFDDLKDVNYEACKSFHQELHSNPADFTFTIVGNASEEQVREYICRYLAGLQPSMREIGASKKYPVVPFPSGIVRKEIRGNQGMGLSCITFPTAVTDDFQEKIISHFCCRLVTARMRDLLSEKSTFSCSFIAAALPEISKTIPTKVVTTFTCDENNLKQTEETLTKVLSALQTTGPTEQEIASARQKMEIDIQESLQSNVGWTAVISGLTNWGRSIDSFEDRKLVHDSMTSEMLKEHFKKIFPLDNYAMVTLLPKAIEAKSIAQ